MASERRHIPVGKQHIGVGNVCIWCDQPMPCREILLDEHQRLLQRSRDEDTARIRLNHARIEAEAEVARLQALLAERDAEIKGLREAIDAVVFSLFYVGVGEARRYYVADGHGPAFSAAVRAALAARGGE